MATYTISNIMNLAIVKILVHIWLLYSHASIYHSQIASFETIVT